VAIPPGSDSHLKKFLMFISRTCLFQRFFAAIVLPAKNEARSQRYTEAELFVMA
jgi:hypothetical protein